METKICSTDGCDKRVDARGLCNKHYAGFKRDGGLGKRCQEPDCAGFAVSRGYCGTHYAALRRARKMAVSDCSFGGCSRIASSYGLCSSHAFQRDNYVPLRTVYVAGEWGDYRITTKGYSLRRRTVNGKREQQFEHRVIMEEHLGRALERHEEIHHLNGNRADNRLENLELWNTSQPKGQRPEDKVSYALEILRLYAPQHLCMLDCT